MLFYHAFCRPVEGEVAGEGANLDRSLDVLEMILRFGLLCTPEWFELHPNPKTTLPEKQQALADGQPYDRLSQVRACFTLTERKGLTTKFSLQTLRGGTVTTSHADEFGWLAIGLDSLTARSMGILPVVYYYDAQKASPFGIDYVAGLSRLLIDRLDEVRTLLAVLAKLEAFVFKDDAKASDAILNSAALTALGIRPKYEHNVESALSKLGLDSPSAAEIFKLFDTDRSPAWQMYDSIELLMSVFQTADSKLDGTAFGFFMQREWRLVHHNIKHLTWFSLGEHPIYSDPEAKRFSDARHSMSEAIRRVRTEQKKKTPESYLNACWVLAEMNGQPFRNLISEIVVPSPAEPRAKDLIERSFPDGNRPALVVIPVE